MTQSRIVKPENLKSETDIRIEEVYLNSGDTIFINQDGLLATLLTKEQMVLYDHNGEFFRFYLEDVAGVKFRSVDFEASSRLTSFWTWTGILTVLACSVGLFIYILALGG